MSTHEKIWNLAKFRFLQGEARLWVISNKELELALVIGIAIWVYFEFFSFGIYIYLKYIGLTIFILCISEIRSRFGL